MTKDEAADLARRLREFDLPALAQAEVVKNLELLAEHARRLAKDEV